MRLPSSILLTNESDPDRRPVQARESAFHEGGAPVAGVAARHHAVAASATSFRGTMMRSTRFYLLVAILWLGLMLQGCASMESAGPAAAPTPARITELYDAFGKDTAMTKDWGTPPWWR